MVDRIKTLAQKNIPQQVDGSAITSFRGHLTRHHKQLLATIWAEEANGPLRTDECLGGFPLQEEPTLSWPRSPNS